MKRFLWWGLGLAISVLLFGQSALAQSVHDFDILSFDAQYRLGKDNEGRSVLKTTETITASFPLFDQSHGIERALPEVYDGHPTKLVVESVTNQAGDALPYESRHSDNNLVLRIGDPDTYVHSRQTYVITYTQRDVTRFFQDTDKDELYWDVNGTQWKQQIDSVTARVTVDSSLVSSMTGATACYQGQEGAAERCETPKSPAVALSFASTRPLKAGETLTFAIGFKPQTFMAYQQTEDEKLAALLLSVWLTLLGVGAFVAVGAIVWMCVVWSRIMNRARGRETIVAEYLPPKEASVLVSAQVINAPTTAVTGQLLDLAVRRYIKIYQTKEKKFLQQSEYELELVKDPVDLHPEEQHLLQDLFGHLKRGERFAMKRLRKEYSIVQKLEASRKKVRSQVRGEYRLYEKAVKEAKRFSTVGTVFLVAGLVTLSPFLVVTAITGYICAYTLWPLTEKGRDLKDYLEGLKLYISVAEKERLQMVQSPEGAEKVGRIDKDDPRQLVKLYERVLPYAVLFGYGKEWLRELGAYYDQSTTQPDWYVGNGAFNAVMFSTAINAFSIQAISYSSPSSSSSSGGSTGGGFSGGGGGGGGGGGW
ncbi:DUF2207 domain-containing protein [Streptomyces caniscabiei]|uniref:DUF2207 domain-containing protein n=1 Tax=Streptomyces caniscabiei TaxID=2746961 RepID=UPI0029B29C80|nr:DUF2207 domain-containing protein [Streptomyces caniscabiei]MDX2776214.1 DUF2207 domain-containing protein [Streptomyces caniscabiei]